jgi:mannose-6-phosphate isomerase class I
VYATPADEFELARLEPAPGARVSIERRAGLEILLCERGPVRVACEGAALELERGGSCLVPADAGPYRVEGAGRLFRAGLPAARSAASSAPEGETKRRRCAS